MDSRTEKKEAPVISLLSDIILSLDQFSSTIKNSLSRIGNNESKIFYRCHKQCSDATLNIFTPEEKLRPSKFVSIIVIDEYFNKVTQDIETQLKENLDKQYANSWLLKPSTHPQAALFNAFIATYNTAAKMLFTLRTFENDNTDPNKLARRLDDAQRSAETFFKKPFAAVDTSFLAAAEKSVRNNYQAYEKLSCAIEQSKLAYGDTIASTTTVYKGCVDKFAKELETHELAYNKIKASLVKRLSDLTQVQTSLQERVANILAAKDHNGPNSLNETRDSIANLKTLFANNKSDFNKLNEDIIRFNTAINMQFRTRQNADAALRTQLTNIQSQHHLDTGAIIVGITSKRDNVLESRKKSVIDAQQALAKLGDAKLYNTPLYILSSHLNAFPAAENFEKCSVALKNMLHLRNTYNDNIKTLVTICSNQVYSLFETEESKYWKKIAEDVQTLLTSVGSIIDNFIHDFPTHAAFEALTSKFKNRAELFELELATLSQRDKVKAYLNAETKLDERYVGLKDAFTKFIEKEIANAYTDCEDYLFNQTQHLFTHDFAQAEIFSKNEIKTFEKKSQELEKHIPSLESHYEDAIREIKRKQQVERDKTDYEFIAETLIRTCDEYENLSHNLTTQRQKMLDKLISIRSKAESAKNLANNKKYAEAKSAINALVQKELAEIKTTYPEYLQSEHQDKFQTDISAINDALADLNRYPLNSFAGFATRKMQLEETLSQLESDSRHNSSDFKLLSPKAHTTLAEARALQTEVEAIGIELKPLPKKSSNLWGRIGNFFKRWWKPILLGTLGCAIIGTGLGALAFTGIGAPLAVGFTSAAPALYTTFTTLIGAASGFVMSLFGTVAIDHYCDSLNTVTNQQKTIAMKEVSSFTKSSSAIAFEVIGKPEKQLSNAPTNPSENKSLRLSQRIQNWGLGLLPIASPPERDRSLNNTPRI